MQHLVTRMQNPELFLHESVALEMVLQVTVSPEEPFQEPLTQGLTLYVAVYCECMTNGSYCRYDFLAFT